MSHPSLAGRATLAVLLLIGFYVLAFALIAALLYVPYAEVTYLHRINGRITLFAIIGAGAIFWAILPRIDRFDPPGPSLERARHPRLFATLDEIARSAEQEMPREVYLVPDMNAWVAQRGGVMGFGSRRVMGLGLPLMQALTISQLRSVLAHEFGHYHGGDTALGPWIYKTRAAIGRTLHTLSNHSAMLMKPFEWYGNAFLRITHAISRRQEFAADALAARVTGTATTVDALKMVHSAGMAFDPYWQTEIMPAIQKGYRPPIADGFREFSAAPSIATSIEKALTHELAEGKADPYDTHPPLRERVAALESAPAVRRETAEDHAMAITLLEDVPTLEVALLDGMLREDYRGKLKPLSWDDAGSELWMPLWREQVRAVRDRLAGLTPAMLPALAADPGGLAVTLGYVRDRGASNDDTTREAAHVIGAAIAIALHDRGFAVRARPGHAVTLVRDDVELAPLSALGDLIAKTLTPEAWRDQCVRAAIASVDLGTVASDRPA
ncbi:MAG TPA: M48 family metallopeptidase [Gemmatimonadaceae bacterium]|nr:M48 family metallopeptidase [Gemmatimonadaceae bacterium]